ncbi:TniQ family protein [Actinoplanes sp. L3-i22]|uniref:TniQ family protein n=1 Tax=Actinoplanes sp. L3-i22 TaxID=2836373 RepID=UPI001C799FC9|nr:TniQ family protein [Actinoplanes sp. L3-i22]BCY10949.1 hypothetical protein L3i22_060370 [Actinoplanes sp. L3-i22]
MTSPSVAVLPRSLDPLTGESLPGYLLRLAYRLDRTPARMLELVGLAAIGPILGPITYLEPASMRAFSTATGLSSDEVRELCLSGLAARYSPLSSTYLGRRRDPARLTTSERWVFGRWSRYCPGCLAGDGSPAQTLHGGCWQRAWRLPPTFACLRHRCLLQHRCPGCGQPPMLLAKGRGRIVPSPTVPGLHPAQCRNPIGPARSGRQPTVCGRRLDNCDDQPATQVTSTAAELQERLTCMLDPAGPETTTTFAVPVAVSTYFTDLRLLTNLICATWPAGQALASTTADAEQVDRHVRQIRDTFAARRDGGEKVQYHAILDQPPADAATTSALLAMAATVLDGEPDVLGDLIIGTTGRRWASHFLRAEQYCSPGMVAAIAPYVAALRPRIRPTADAAETTRPRRRRRPPPASPRPSPRRRSRPARASRALPPRPVLPSPLPQDGPGRYRAWHIPAFLTDDWNERYLAGFAAGFSPRLLRRATAVMLIQLAEPCHIPDAADFLDVSSEAAQHACDELRTWLRQTGQTQQYLKVVDRLCAELNQRALIRDRLPDYGLRRRAMAHWVIPDDGWEHLLSHLRRVGRTNWGERKRNTVSALIWTKVTQGEHLFAPHRRSAPGFRPGSPEDRGLDIDRAWWRIRNNEPDQHYPRLDALCERYAADLAWSIDHPSNPATPAS